MKRAGHVTQQSFRISLLLLLAALGMPASASEQGVLPILTWHWWGLGGPFTSPEAAFAYVNQKRAEWWDLPPATDLRPCPAVNWHNGMPDSLCWTDPENSEPAGYIGMWWSCPAE